MAVLVAGGTSAKAQNRPNIRLDSLERALAGQTRADTNRVKTLNEIASALRMSDPGRATVIANQSLVLAHRIKFDRGEAGANFQAGVLAAMRGDLKLADSLFSNSLNGWKKLNNLREIGSAQNGLASVRVQQGEMKEAAELYISSLKIAEKNHDQRAQAVALLNMGNVSTRMLDQEKAINYFQQSRVLIDTIKDAPMYAGCLRNIGNAYLSNNQPNEGESYLRAALRMVRQIGDKRGEGGVLFSLGRLALDRKQLVSGAELLGQALEIARKTGDRLSEAQSLAWLGDAERQQNLLPKALAHYQDALKIAQQNGAYADLVQIHHGLAATYAAQKQFDKAFKSQYLQSIYSDSAATDKLVSETHELQTKYETEKKEAQNRLQAAQLRTQQQVIRRRNTQLMAGLLVVALLAGLAYLLYVRRRLRREVEFAQERQQLTQLRAQAVLEAEEAERRRIGSDLHDGVGQLLTVAKLNLHALGEELQLDTLGPQTMLQNALDVVNESFLEVRQISHNLMPNALIKRGLAQAVRDFLSKVSPDDRLKINLEVVGLDSGGRLPPTVENVLFRVIQELVQNIIKHAQASEMTLQLVRGPEDLTVLVEDNGVGFDPAALDPETSGIGLKNIESRLAFLGGRAEFDSRPGHGTTVTLAVPA